MVKPYHNRDFNLKELDMSSTIKEQMEPLISIIVPVYNAEKYLNRCINSLLDQTYTNIEIILINDNSTDTSGDICNFYRSNNKIKVLHHEVNSGSAGSGRNSGLKIASGAYFAFVDSDDWVHPDMIKIMHTAIQNSNTKIAECGLIGTGVYFIEQIENITIKTIVETRLNALKRIINTQRFSVCVRLYERSLLEDIKFLENVMSEDVYFTLEVFNKIKEVVKIDVPLYYYFQSPNSVTRKAYSIKHIDSLNSGLYLQSSLQNTNKNDPLSIIIQYHILRKLIFHYKMLNYHPNVDPTCAHRKRLKMLIDKNYFKSKNHDIYLKLAKFLSVRAFEFLINLNKFRHKVFNTNQF